MAISPKYENFSFVGSNEDLFTKYKRKCADKTLRQKRSKYITTGVVLFLLIALVVGLSIGLHVTKSAKKVESSEEVDIRIEINDENNTAHIDGIISSDHIMNKTVPVTLTKDHQPEGEKKSNDQRSAPCLDGSPCP